MNTFKTITILAMTLSVTTGSEYMHSDSKRSKYSRVIEKSKYENPRYFRDQVKPRKNRKKRNLKDIKWQ